MHAPLAFQLPVIAAGRLQGIPFHRAATGHQREAPDALQPVMLSYRHTLLTAYQGINLHIGFVMGRLGAPFAVLRAFSRPGIDYRARIEDLRAKPPRDFAGALPKLLMLLRGDVTQAKSLIGRDFPAFKYLVFK